MTDWMALESTEKKDKPNDYSSGKYDLNKAAEEISKITLNFEKK